VADRDVARGTLLEEQFGCLDDRLAVEAFAHQAVVDDIVDGHDRHALVVSHEAADDRELLVFAQPGAGVVDGFAVAVRASRAQGGQAPVVLRRLGRQDHRG